MKASTDLFDDVADLLRRNDRWWFTPVEVTSKLAIKQSRGSPVDFPNLDVDDVESALNDLHEERKVVKDGSTYQWRAKVEQGSD